MARGAPAMPQATAYGAALYSTTTQLHKYKYRL